MTSPCALIWSLPDPSSHCHLRRLETCQPHHLPLPAHAGHTHLWVLIPSAFSLSSCKQACLNDLHSQEASPDCPLSLIRVNCLVWWFSKCGPWEFVRSAHLNPSLQSPESDTEGARSPVISGLMSWAPLDHTSHQLKKQTVLCPLAQPRLLLDCREVVTRFEPGRRSLLPSPS